MGLVVEVGDGIELDVDKGDKVFFRCNPVEIEDVKIIDGGCVIAYEKGD